MMFSFDSRTKAVIVPLKGDVVSTCPEMFATLPALNAGISPDATGLPFMESMTTFILGIFSAMAGSPSSEYCNLFVVWSCLDVIMKFFARR